MVSCLFCQMGKSGECVFCRLKKKANDSYQDLLHPRQPVQPGSLRGNYPTDSGSGCGEAADRMYSFGRMPSYETLLSGEHGSDSQSKSYSLDGSGSTSYAEGKSYAAAGDNYAGGEYESN